MFMLIAFIYMRLGPARIIPRIVGIQSELSVQARSARTELIIRFTLSSVDIRAAEALILPHERHSNSVNQEQRSFSQIL